MFLAGIKKEFKLFGRGFKFWGILLLIIGIAASYPLLYKTMELMTDQMAQMGNQMGGSMQTATDSMNGMIEGLKELYGGSMAGVGFYTAVTSFTSTGFLVMALLLMETAGGEQKKRSVIMLNCAGLTPSGYILPKFAVYPLLLGIMTFLGTLACWGITSAVYNMVMPIEDVMFSGACAAIYIVFMISAYILFGTCTGRPGVGVIVMFLGSAIVPIILSGFNIQKYNPFVLPDLLMTSYAEADMNNFMLSAAVSIILSVICCVLSLLVTTLKKIDNSEAEANL